MGVSIVFEGNEGAGKTTRALLSRLLIESTTSFPVDFVREPGGTAEADLIRSLVKGDQARNMHPNTNMLLYSASRNELIEHRIKPFFKENPNGITIGDRSWLSTLALQLAEGAKESYTESVQEPFMRYYPDKFFYVDVPVEESIVRLYGASKYNERDVDWRDIAGRHVLGLYRRNYLELVKKYTKVDVIDGFEEPWIVAMKARETVLRMTMIRNMHNDEIRETAETELKSFTVEHLQEFARRAMVEGITVERNGRKEIEKVNIQKMTEETEAARRELGERSSDDLRYEMFAEWVSLGIEPTHISKERL